MAFSTNSLKEIGFILCLLNTFGFNIFLFFYFLFSNSPRKLITLPYLFSEFSEKLDNLKLNYYNLNIEDSKNLIFNNYEKYIKKITNVIKGI